MSVGDIQNNLLRKTAVVALVVLTPALFFVECGVCLYVHRDEFSLNGYWTGMRHAWRGERPGVLLRGK
ncbi:MAG: hypothetical protein LBK60_03140 [Verrucomicrobiales bacterium]|jgi:hypothetical protein|nr:hypothetical protein [Verrucomicrobiales bacterium]